MKLSHSVKSISYLKSHTAEIFSELANSQQPLIVTQNGEAKAVVQDITSYENTQEALALLKLLTKSAGNIAQNKTKPVAQAFRDIKKSITQK